MSFIYDFFTEFVAAFLGFLFAILLDRINRGREEKNKQIMIVNGIYNELEDIYKSLNEYVQDNVVLRHRIATPTWDSLQYSGGVISLMNRHYYDNLITVYSAIKVYNEEYNELSNTNAINSISSIFSLAHSVLDSILKEDSNVKNSKVK